MSLCTIPGCPKPLHSHEMCSMHWSRWTRTGSLEATVIRGSGVEAVEARYLQKVKIGNPDACWPWTAQISPDGYGRFNRTVVGGLAHRYAWYRVHGDIPDGFVLDHTCHDPEVCPGGPGCPHRRCQNPTHLELVTNAHNASVERRVTPNSEKTECKHGHEYTETNTLWSTNRQTGRLYRQCRACARQRYHNAKRQRGGG